MILLPRLCQLWLLGTCWDGCCVLLIFHACIAVYVCVFCVCIVLHCIAQTERHRLSNLWLYLLLFWSRGGSYPKCCSFGCLLRAVSLVDSRLCPHRGPWLSRASCSRSHLLCVRKQMSSSPPWDSFPSSEHTGHVWGSKSNPQPWLLASQIPLTPFVHWMIESQKEPWLENNVMLKIWARGMLVVTTKPQCPGLYNVRWKKIYKCSSKHLWKM